PSGRCTLERRAKPVATCVGRPLRTRLMAKPVIAVIALLGLLTSQATAAADAVVQRASVSPKRGFTDSVDGVQVEFRIAASAPADVTIRVVGSGDEVRRIEVPGVQPGADRTVRWDGLTN